MFPSTNNLLHNFWHCFLWMNPIQCFHFWNEQHSSSTQSGSWLSCLLSVSLDHKLVSQFPLLEKMVEHHLKFVFIIFSVILSGFNPSNYFMNMYFSQRLWESKPHQLNPKGSALHIRYQARKKKRVWFLFFFFTRNRSS